MAKTNQAPSAERVEIEPIDYDYYRARAHALRQQAKRDITRALLHAVRRLFRNLRQVSARPKISLR